MEIDLPGDAATVGYENGVLRVYTDQVGGPPSGATEVVVDTNVTKAAVMNLIYGLTQVLGQMG